MKDRKIKMGTEMKIHRCWKENKTNKEVFHQKSEMEKKLNPNDTLNFKLIILFTPIIGSFGIHKGSSKNGYIH